VPLADVVVGPDSAVDERWRFMRETATQAARNLVMDLEDAGCRVKYLIRDRDGKYPAGFDQVLADAGITVVRSGIRVPRMNAAGILFLDDCEERSSA
jgi:hypothetical protein